MDTIGERIRGERKRLGLSQEAFAALGDSSKPSQVRYENGERSPDGNYLAKVAAAGADVLYILTGERTEVSLPETALDVIFGMQRRQMADELQGSPPEFVAVPLYSANLAAGHGAQNDTDEIVEHLAFRRSWLKDIGLSVSRAALAHVHGDSMLPGIHHGDIVLIDTSKRQVPLRSPVDSGIRHRAPIFALHGNEGVLIKRLLRPTEDQLMIISDNPDYLPRITKIAAGADTSVIGKVMWWGHTNKE